MQEQGHNLNREIETLRKNRNARNQKFCYRKNDFD